MAVGDVLPRRNLPDDAEPWGRAVEGRLEDLGRSVGVLRQFSQAQNRDTASTLDALTDSVRNLDDVTRRLVDASQVYYADSDSTVWTLGSADWTSSPVGPTVQASSLSGRFRVTVSISAGNGAAAGVFSAPDYPRSRAMGASPSAVRSRVGVVGGVNYISTGSASWIVLLDPEVTHTFQAHGLNLNGTPSFPVDIYNLALTVEPLL